MLVEGLATEPELTGRARAIIDNALIAYEKQVTHDAELQEAHGTTALAAQFTGWARDARELAALFASADVIKLHGLEKEDTTSRLKQLEVCDECGAAVSEEGPMVSTQHEESCSLYGEEK